MAKLLSQKPPSTSRILILLIYLSITALFVWPTAANQDQDLDLELRQEPKYLIRDIAKQNKPISLIIVQQDDDWLVSVAAPAAAMIHQVNKTPILLKLTSKENVRQKKMLDKLSPLAGFCTILSSNSSFTPDQTGENSTIYNIRTKSEPSETSLLLAGHYWQKINSVVMVSRNDPAAIITGSALACHYRVPVVVLDDIKSPNNLSEKLGSLNVSHITFVTSEKSTTDFGVHFPGQKTELIDIEETQKRIIQKLNAERIQNIILFRIPDGSFDEDSISWLAPYLSLIHGSALVPCFSCDPSEARSKTESLIHRYSLRPRTITILGDYEAIDIVTTTTDDPNALEISSELFSPSAEGRACRMGIGRIPFHQLWAATTLIAYGAARNHIIAQQQPNVLMIANPKTDFDPLPLCETISRSTAAEFKNSGIQTNEFYSVSCNSPLIRDSLENSQFIIYEGHITDFSLFEEPSYFEDAQEIRPYEYDESCYEHYNDTTDFTQNDNDTEDYDDTPDYDDSSNDAPVNTQEQSEEPDSDYHTFDEDMYDRPYDISHTTEYCKLEAAPLVIIQSCHSLEDSVLDILTCGAIGAIGSKTNIHSASGSSFIKAFCDGILYRDDNIGEAMRDAKNYLLSVSSLKKARGHSQYVKVERVAYGFQLWGDPELRVYPDLKNNRKTRPVSGTFVRPNKITVKIPNKRLATSRTEKYFLRMFPGSEAAGILKKIKDKEIRRVAPLYFFRIPMPKGFDPSKYAGLKKADDTTVRAEFRVDSFRRFIYVIYFPEKEEKGQVFTLEFIPKEIPAGIQF
ncbi:MAG: hypothetical protein JW837_13260 [Sedimentisphaerales bacterium]|nr:hypothetical protein [Sedimentisphaerales bacterium]